MKPGDPVIIQSFPEWLAPPYARLSTTTGREVYAQDLVGRLAIYKGRHGDQRIYRILPEGVTLVLYGTRVLTGPEAQLALTTKGITP